MNPTSPRDLAPDVLRGFALFGIALVNVAFFAIDPALGATGDWVRGAGNTVAAFLVWALAQGKFYLLFSFLFGYSSQYVVKADPARRPRWTARAFALLALGAAHGALLFHGDILFAYGLLALPFGALMFRDAATLRRWAGGVFVATAALQALLVWGLWAAEHAGEPSAALTGSTLDVVLQDGTYAASIAARFELFAVGLPSGLVLQGGFAFVAFLLGLLAARAGVLGAGARVLDPRRLMAWGFGLGLPLQAASAWMGVANELSATPSDAVAVGAIAFGLTTAPLLAAGYVGALLWVLERRPAWVAWLRWPGRMSLTTYLGQSLVLATVFGPWGLGLYQRLPYWGTVLVAVATYGVLAVLARLVLGRFRHGPFEWAMSAWTRWSTRDAR
ncbi:MAG: DUF418 domain-containing protein [Trueperaceae bacterium]|nr:DUF418 domain-containing protein [Trueperaceae bacterium]